MTVFLKFVTVGWDPVEGSTSYKILRDGVAVSSTRTRCEAKIGVADGADHLWTIRALPSGVEQSLKADWQIPSLVVHGA